MARRRVVPGHSDSIRTLCTGRPAGVRWNCRNPRRLGKPPRYHGIPVHTAQQPICLGRHSRTYQHLVIPQGLEPAPHARGNEGALAAVRLGANQRTTPSRTRVAACMWTHPAARQPQTNAKIRNCSTSSTASSLQSEANAWAPPQDVSNRHQAPVFRRHHKRFALPIHFEAITLQIAPLHHRRRRHLRAHRHPQGDPGASKGTSNIRSSPESRSNHTASPAKSRATGPHRKRHV